MGYKTWNPVDLFSLFYCGKSNRQFTSISGSVPVPSAPWRRSSAPRWGKHAWSWDKPGDHINLRLTAGGRVQHKPIGKFSLNRGFSPVTHTLGAHGASVSPAHVLLGLGEPHQNLRSDRPDLQDTEQTWDPNWHFEFNSAADIKLADLRSPDSTVSSHFKYFEGPVKRNFSEFLEINVNFWLLGHLWQLLKRSRFDPFQIFFLCWNLGGVHIHLDIIPLKFGSGKKLEFFKHQWKAF